MDTDGDSARWADCCANFKAWLLYAPRTRETAIYIFLFDGTGEGNPIESAPTSFRGNGLEVRRQLVQLYKPRTKSRSYYCRSISSLSALMNLPPFVKDKTWLQQDLGIERFMSTGVQVEKKFQTI